MLSPVSIGGPPIQIIPHDLERYRATFGHAGIGIALVALDGRWLDVNPAYCDLVGYSKAELLEMCFQEITVPEDLVEDLDCYRRLQAGEIRDYSLKKRYVHKSGRPVWVDLTVTLVHPPGADPYAVAMARDASQTRREMVKLTTELGHTRRERDAFFELSHDLLVILEVRAGEGYFQRANPALCKLLQFSEDELKSRPVHAWVHPEDVGYARELMLGLHAGLPTPCEYRYVTRHQHVRWLSWSMSCADDLYYCVARDVTEERDRARLDAEHQRRLTAASKLSALGRMAANISHEIKNPLSIIYGNAIQLQKVLGAQAPETARRMLDEVQAMSMRIVKIIDGLRGFSREAGRDPFALVPLRQILDDTLAFCEARFAQDQLEFRREPVADDIFLRCQPVQIQQALLNLLNNAHDAVLSGAADRKAMGIRHRADRDRVQIFVYDGGDGVEAEVRARLFEPFVTTKQVGKGTGLGLNIAREIVTAHRGRIYLDQTQSETTFVVELPRAYPSPPVIS